MFFCDKPDRPIFLRTFILDEASASNICSHVIIALDELAKYEISIVASITDNARNMVAAMRQLSEVHPTGCGEKGLVATYSSRFQVFIRS